jgi:hypothetical protein
MGLPMPLTRMLPSARNWKYPSVSLRVLSLKAPRWFAHHHRAGARYRLHRI